MSDSTSGSIKLGLTLYSMTNEWVSGQYTIETLLEKVAEAGIGPGVELVGYQSIRGFPDVSDDFIAHWRGLLDRLGLTATCLSTSMDVAARRDRMQTEEELAESLIRQLHAAAKLGCSIVRVQMGATPGVLTRALPTAEALGISMGMEIHAPEGPLTPKVMKVREMYDRLDSPLLGFIPDFSSTMRALPASELDYYVARGLPAETLPALKSIWAKDGSPFERLQEFSALARQAGASDSALSYIVSSFTMHGHEPVESWREIVPQVVHVHGKFYEMDADGIEPSIDIPAIIDILVDGGYQGYISSEWEAHVFREAGEADPFALIAKQHRLIEASLAAADKLEPAPGAGRFSDR
ncbi:MAG TPA: TIM barrel protein [Microbacterium sp.]|uniref:sugar phosphate isomerase/epimerase family protein n=1 Tax=Microbacterium sp. TaxID=51671 RepID=UPI002CB44C03|nr:TIM barrel protein [Microbacterium sp.]HWI30745.1 TIM barrel protein [Microbacterium sp.]